MAEYVFLMRHAAHDQGRLTTEAIDGVCNVADRFAEWLDARRVEVLVECTAGPEVESTTAVLAAATNSGLERLGDDSVRLVRPRDDHDLPALSEELRTSRVGLGAYRPDVTPFTSVHRWLEGIACGDDRRAPLLVGNDPLIGWLAGELAGEAIPVRRGELLFLTRRWSFGIRGWQRRWKLGWSISPTEDVLSISTKIESKMNTAKALGAVITALMVFLVTNALLSSPTVYEWLAFVALGTSSAGYFGALFLYDSLLMPSGFWANRFPRDRAAADKSPSGSSAESSSRMTPPELEEQIERPPTARILEVARDRVVHGRTGVERPPSPTDRVLQQAMISIWNSLFRPATIFVGIGVVLLAIGAAEPGDATAAWFPNLPTIAAATIAWAAAIACWIGASRPQLGVSD